VKIVTGDNESVTRHLCAVPKVSIAGVLDGAHIAARRPLCPRPPSAPTSSAA